MRWGARTTEMDKGSSKGDAKEIALVVIPKEIRRQAEARQTQAECSKVQPRGRCQHRTEWI